MDAPRNDLIRMAPLVELRADGGDGRTLFGYGAKFNEPTVINSWEGNFTEIIAPGAFKRTLRNNGKQVKVLFNHGFDPSIGDKPLGRASVLREDKTGLYVEVPLSRTSYNDDLIELLNDGALDGMSFRFSVVNEEWTQPEAKSNKLPVRTITEAKLYELGPVTFPAYEATTAGVRNRQDFDTWRLLDESKRAAVLEIVRAGMGGMGSGPMDDGQMMDPHDFQDDNGDGLCDQCGNSADDHLNEENVISGTPGRSTPANGTVSAGPADSNTTRTDSEPTAATTPGITPAERRARLLVLKGIAS